jgi:SAM-dependent methyltransferase
MESTKKELMKLFRKKRGSSPIGPGVIQTNKATVSGNKRSESLPDSNRSFLPFATSTEFNQVHYLRQVVVQGGPEVERYKAMSFDWLQLEPGMQVLDVGCGRGIDLPILAERVGQTGQVIGLDHDPDQLRAAQEAVAGKDHVRVVMGEAERMPFPDASFDRVRADRVLQHIPWPEQALAEMWRVLRPGGIVTLVEPDWKTMALFPGSPAGGDDDHTLSTIVAWNQQHIPHALIGRQLRSLLHQNRNETWERVQVQGVALSFSSWAVVDNVLLITRSAQRLLHEDPVLADEIRAWLQAIERADSQGQFLAVIPLFFASACKELRGV